MLSRPVCPICGSPCPPGACAPCLDALPTVPGVPRVRGLDRCHALWAYEGATRDLVAELKYRRRRDLLTGIADRLAAHVVAAGSLAPATVVTWAPTTPRRSRHRGADHAELLARALARRWRLPCRALLRRRPGPAQTGRDGAARRDHAGYVATGVARVPVLVVDDVVTTGATLRAAARALRAADATEVAAVAVARTP